MDPFLPVIDLAAALAEPHGDSPGARDTATALDAVCRRHGFFYLTGHGVGSDRLEALFEATRRLFALPEALKDEVHVARSPARRGYDPMGVQRLDPSRPPDRKEGFSIGPAGNQWPREAALPGFRAAAEAYFADVSALGRSLMGLLGMALGLPRDHFAAAMTRSASGLKLLHYPPQAPGAETSGRLGAGAHTDWQAITLLAQDDCGGLQVAAGDGTWRDVPPLPGAFVVNLGDLMARWTNDRYRSTLHRVDHRSPDRDRYSIAHFVEVDDDTVIEPLPGCLTAANPARYPVVTAGEHLREMYVRSRRAA